MNTTAIEFAQKYWKKRLLSSPRGALLLNNSFFEQLNKKNKLYMLHVTASLDRIVDRGRLYMSGGCMIGSIYCTPLSPTSQGLIAHNLGAYIYERESLHSLEAKSISNRLVNTMVIEVDISTLQHTEPIGVSYLHSGKIHFQTYQTIIRKLPQKLRNHLEGNIVKQFSQVQLFLKACKAELLQGKEIPSDQFFSQLTQSVVDLPILGYLYFEALSEYIILYSKDKRSHQLMKKGELNCWGYKESIFRLRPNLLCNFNLASFNPNIIELQRVINELEQENLVHIRFVELLKYLKKRIIFLINSCLLGSSVEPELRSNLTWEFDNLSTLFPHLVGHAIDREIRQTDQYKNYHNLFDEFKAKSIWNYWNEMHIAIPFNGILPKGEIGINPTYSNLRYKIYRGKPQYINNELYVQPDQELAIRILPQLIPPKYSFMGIGG